MRIDRLLWNDYRIEHIADHGVDPEEVWEACHDPYHIAHRKGRKRYLLYGQTETGRYLFVVLERSIRSEFEPITARDMNDQEKRAFRRLQK